MISDFKLALSLLGILRMGVHFSIRATRLKEGVPVSSSELSPPMFSF